MERERRVSIAVGVLYILGTVFGIVSVVLMNPLQNADNYLSAIAAHELRYMGGIFAVFLMGASLSFIPILLFPLLKKKYEKSALVCLVFRSGLEMVNYIMAVLLFLGLFFFAKNSVPLAIDSGLLYLLGDTIKDLTRNPVLIFVFSIYAFTLYMVFYRSKLIPRWISIFGIVAIALHFITTFLELFGIQESFSTANLIMNFPIFIQEMIMAAYLIIRGFKREAAIL
ncbi:MAG: DUF4386 domain-containing protein [Spirochaetia bacterium]|nr:DUF4386 domain-containing protein [Spirochaetia bacterium]